MSWGKEFALQLASDVRSHVRIVESAVMSSNNQSKAFENLTTQLFAKFIDAIESARAALGIGENISCIRYTAQLCIVLQETTMRRMSKRQRNEAFNRHKRPIRVWKFRRSLSTFQPCVTRRMFCRELQYFFLHNLIFDWMCLLFIVVSEIVRTQKQLNESSTMIRKTMTCRKLRKFALKETDTHLKVNIYNSFAF